MQILERVCRQLVAASGGDPDATSGNMVAWKRVENLGRAVLEELREPDKAMLDAGIECLDEALAIAGCYSIDDGWTEEQFRHLQSAVIGAALKDGRPD